MRDLTMDEMVFVAGGGNPAIAARADAAAAVAKETPEVAKKVGLTVMSMTGTVGAIFAGVIDILTSDK